MSEETFLTRESLDNAIRSIVRLNDDIYRLTAVVARERSELERTEAELRDVERRRQEELSIVRKILASGRPV